MADGIHVDTRQLDAALAAAAQSVEDMTEAHAAAGELLVSGTAQRTPVKSGRLAASWTATATATGVEIRSDEEYAGVIEYGSAERGIEGVHMAADALEASERDLAAVYEEGLARAFRHAGFEVRS